MIAVQNVIGCSGLRNSNLAITIVQGNFVSLSWALHGFSCNIGRRMASFWIGTKVNALKVRNGDEFATETINDLNKMSNFLSSQMVVFFNFHACWNRKNKRMRISRFSPQDITPTPFQFKCMVSLSISPRRRCRACVLAPLPVKAPLWLDNFFVVPDKKGELSMFFSFNNGEAQVQMTASPLPFHWWATKDPLPLVFVFFLLDVFRRLRTFISLYWASLMDLINANHCLHIFESLRLNCLRIVVHTIIFFAFS